MTDTEINKFKELTGLDFIPEWGYTKVKALSELKNNYFYQTLDPKIIKESIIDLSQVVGSIYFDNQYNDLTWAQMRIYLLRNKRNNIDQINNIIDNMLADNLSYSKFGHEYYITSGQHRTCIAKFFGRETVPGTVTEYVFDYELYGMYNYLKRFFTIDRYYEEKHIEGGGRIYPHWRLEQNNKIIECLDRESITELVSYMKIMKVNLVDKLRKRFQKVIPDDYLVWSVNQEKIKRQLKHTVQLSL